MRTTLLLHLLCFLLAGSLRAQESLPAFSATPVTGCSPLVVNFTDNSTGTPTAWLWDFGNGATSTLKNPSTTYFSPGNYTVTLTISNATGSRSTTRTNYITVYGNPKVQFNGSDSLGCYPFPVQFTDLSGASPGTVNTGWIWDLGDGTQSVQQHPHITYLNTGQYTVSLKVTNDKGCWSVATKQSYIRLNGGVAANFQLTGPLTCRTPFDIDFTNTSSGPGNLRYTWDFGDGSASYAANPRHTYTAEGQYSVMLVTESDKGCRDTLRKDGLLNLHNTTTTFSAPDSVCVNEAVRFTNTSPGNTSAVRWQFGDGTNATATSPVKQFTTPGTYRVKLQHTYSTCSDSAEKILQVFARPTAGFTANATYACQPPLSVAFKNTATGAVAYQWNFGDGTTATEANPTHTFTNFGTYTVTLVTTNAAGCTDTLQQPAFVHINKPEIQFDSLPQEGCLPLGVSFRARVSTPDPVVSYHWDFGDGATATSASPAYTYTRDGVYAVSLTVTTQSGCTNTMTLPGAVRAGKKPQVQFSAMPTRPCAFQSIPFTNQTPEGTIWHWDFGDGGTSSSQSPVYAYSDTGTFTVKLIADNNGCKDSLERVDYITIKGPIANFQYQTSCSNKRFFTFTDRSVGATSWVWDFGDGTTSTDQNPVHTFAQDGTYTIQLTVRNDTCFHLKKQVVSIVHGTPDFTSPAPSVCRGTAVQFTADTTYATNIRSYRWNFGDGSPPVSGRTASRLYTQPGRYTVSLTIQDLNGCLDSVVKQQLVQIMGPTAGFTATNVNGCKGLQASFANTSASDGHSPIEHWQWNLGDGTFINQDTPAPVTHTYRQAGAFTVSLAVSDTAGCTDTLRLPSLVQTSNIKADFASADTVSCPGATIRFTNTSMALTAYTAEWHFGNGTSSSLQNPAIAYTADGNYSVQLKIADALGCTDSVTKEKYIAIRHPVAAYSISDSASSCIPFQVKFTNQSSHYTSFIWDLGGGTSRLANPVQYYNKPGVYQTKLMVTSPGGCTDTATRKITVYDMSASRVTYLPLDGCKPLTVNLQAYSVQKMNFVWDFGDGAILQSNDTATTHVYNAFGNFVPKVIMTDSAGCVVPITGVDTIRIEGATAKFGLDKRFFCDSGQVRFIDSTTFNTTITAYHWDFGDGTTSAQTSPSHFYAQPGLYSVSLNVQTENGCVDTFRLAYPVKVASSPAIRIVGDSIICAGEGIAHLGLFERADTAQVHWAWTFPNGNTAAVQRPLRQYYTTAGRFRVQTIATNNDGCRDTAYQNILVHPIPSVTLPATLTTLAGTPVRLPATYSNPALTYQWAPESLDCPTCPQPVAHPKLNTHYTVHITDSNGCRNSGQVQVIVLCNNDNVFVPNTFSPNGDGSNDVFYVRGKGLSRVKTLRIFNRWGQVVFERSNFPVNDISLGWDGRFQGAKPVPDVYVYQLEVFCDNSQVIRFEGNVALIQ